MAKHHKERLIERACVTCGTGFQTGSSIKVHCSPECRIKDAASAFKDSDACWEWPGSLNPATGYGQLSAWEGGKRVLLTAHRVSFSAFNGPIPDGLHICHHCDNRKCFNPAHLFAGTARDNMQDMWSKGRGNTVVAAVHWTKLHPERIKRGQEHHLVKDSSCMPRGANHPRSKLKDDDIRAIRASNETLAVLSARYGVTQANLSSIRLGKTWAHVR